MINAAYIRDQKLLISGEVTLDEAERARLAHFFRELAEAEERKADAERRKSEAAQERADKREARRTAIAIEAESEMHPPIQRPRQYGGLKFKRLR